MSNTKTLSLSIVVVVINILIGHLFAPYGIMFTPVVLIIVSVLLGLINVELRPILKTVVLAVLISLHDIGIKLFSGGRHDQEGLGFIHLFLFVGLIPAYGILIGGIFNTKENKIKNKWIATILFPLIMLIHLLLFERLGLGRNYWYEWNG